MEIQRRFKAKQHLALNQINASLGSVQDQYQAEIRDKHFMKERSEREEFLLIKDEEQW